MSERTEKMDREREEQTSETLPFWDLIGRVKNKGVVVMKDIRGGSD